MAFGQDPAAAAAAKTARRRLQAETVVRVVEDELDPTPYVIVGDMNDTSGPAF